MTIKKSLLKKASIFLGSLMLLGLLVYVIGPVMSVEAAVDPCGDGVCDFNSENNDLCPEDCHCNDNGVEDPGEGCGCKDMICEGEAVASACGTPVGADGECPGDLVDAGGICWNRCTCQGICSEDDEVPEVDVCATYLICDGIFHDHPVSREDSRDELLRLSAGRCFGFWGYNFTRYYCRN